MTDGYYGVAIFFPGPTMHTALWARDWCASKMHSMKYAKGVCKELVYTFF